MINILKNIIDNPSQIEKYGDLNKEKIAKKLSNCKPLWNLLFVLGFRTSQDNKRIKFTIVKNLNESIKLMKLFHGYFQGIPKQTVSNNPPFYETKTKCKDKPITSLVSCTLCHLT